jgi:hypothetical protein
MTDTETREDHQQTLLTGNVTDDSRPQQFKAIEDWLHAERERVNAVAQGWRPGFTQDVRNMRSAQLLGETLLSLGKPRADVPDGESVRMQSSLGSASVRHDLVESCRL